MTHEEQIVDDEQMAILEYEWRERIEEQEVKEWQERVSHLKFLKA